MSIDVPTPEDLVELTTHRHAGSTSIYLASEWAGSNGDRSAIAHDPEAARAALRSAANEALRELERIGSSRADREALSESVRGLEQDRELWETQGRTIALFLAPGVTRTFRLMNELPPHMAVGDRFDVGPLVRATTFAHRGFVLAVTVGDVKLVQIDADASHRELDLESLPDDAALALEAPDTDGRFDRHRADGALGPKVEQRRYCSIVQDAVLTVIGDSHLPLVLAAAADLEPAYREINTYRALLHRGIDANPGALSVEDLVARSRRVLDEHYASVLADWRETFGTRQAHGSASTQLTDIARAATAGLVDTLLFDLASNEEGEIDDAGTVIFAPEPGPTTYGLVDEIAARVLRTGGTVKAVRREELPDSSSPVAATLRTSP